ncbi:SLC13 family permease [Geoglobus acetivorans]|uniref:Citrate transporter-like domain-containing protein n=1 Tax=Geoglobus acetivorans TaxID=565033 RepID=A0ABZ3H7N9_GEOAI|nr:citrate transporter [Geoglobus acetivorans]
MKYTFETVTLLILLAMLAVLAAVFPDEAAKFSDYTDWRAILSLAGLLLVSEGARESGYLSSLAYSIAGSSKTERTLVFKLCMLSATLGAFITNDAAVMVVVPLTMSLKDHIDVRKAVALEVISANAGSTLTPIGNPQNLLIWHVWGVSFVEFTATMAKFVLVQLAVLSIMVLLVENRPVSAYSKSFRVDEFLKMLSLALLILLVIALDFGAHWFVAVVVSIYLIFFRRVVMNANWLLVAIFALMFVDFRTIASVFIHTANLTGANVFLASIVTSQIINNVPAALIMTGIGSNYPAIAAGVNIGGNGLLTASFANLIAYGIVRDSRFLREYHLFSFTYLLMCVLLVLWLFF